MTSGCPSTATHTSPAPCSALSRARSPKLPAVGPSPSCSSRRLPVSLHGSTGSVCFFLEHERVVFWQGQFMFRTEDTEGSWVRNCPQAHSLLGWGWLTSPRIGPAPPGCHLLRSCPSPGPTLKPQQAASGLPSPHPVDPAAARCHGRFWPIVLTGEGLAILLDWPRVIQGPEVGQSISTAQLSSTSSLPLTTVSRWHSWP